MNKTRQTVGPVVVYDLNRKRCREPAVPGNQATYLFFPVLFAFVCVLLTNLSTPIIGSMSVFEMNTHGNGTVSFGAWGWCATGVPNITDQCSPHRAFGNDMLPEFTNLPKTLQPLADISNVLPGSYVAASAVFHMFAALFAWMTITWTLAASGSWAKKEVHAHGWTRWAFALTLWSSLFILISWALDIASLTRVQGHDFSGWTTQPTITPGPAIWLMMLAFVTSLACFVTRFTYLKFKPRPLWTIKGGDSDFHDNYLRSMPDEAEVEAEIADEKTNPPGYAL